MSNLFWLHFVGLNAADENTTGSGEKRTQLHERTNSMKNR